MPSGLAPPEAPSLSLASTEAHVWVVDLRSGPAPLGESPVEGRRRRREVLQSVLSRYLGVDRGSVPLEASGKPRLSDGPLPDLRFNTSHSGGLMLVAVALAKEVGVDIQSELNGLRPAHLAERFMSPAELRGLRAIPPAARGRHILRSWALKEAYVKATGAGLGADLRRIDFEFQRGWGKVRGWEAPGGPWWVRDLTAVVGEPSALAVSGHPVSPRIRRWYAT